MPITPRTIAAVFCCACITGCAAPRIQTTQLTSTDVVEMTDNMTASLTSDEVVSARSPQSDTWVFSIDRVRNLTEHPMSMNERWGTMARLRSRLAQTDFARERNIVWILPPDLGQQYASDSYDSSAQRRLPTHSLHATFYSDTNTSLAGRSDAYLCAFTLTDLATGLVIWEDSFEVKYTQRSDSIH
jgi:PBP1b-binding outer membrane lipoprotein LpoB